MLPKNSSVMAAGASSFGMSGVNAHGLFLAPGELRHTRSAVAWQGVRHWMVPQAHHMLNLVSCSRSEGTCGCALLRTFNSPTRNSAPSLKPAVFNSATTPANCTNS